MDRRLRSIIAWMALIHAPLPTLGWPVCRADEFADARDAVVQDYEAKRHEVETRLLSLREIALARGAAKEIASREADVAIFRDTGFVSAACPEFGRLASKLDGAGAAYRRSLVELAKRFPAQKREIQDLIVDFDKQRRVDLSGTWEVLYPGEAASRPYVFEDDGKRVKITAGPHPATDFVRGDASVEWDADAKQLRGMTKEIFMVDGREEAFETTLGFKVLDPNTLEGHEYLILDFKTGKKSPLKTRYHRVIAP